MYFKLINKCQKEILRCAPPSSHVCDFCNFGLVKIVCFCHFTNFGQVTIIIFNNFGQVMHLYGRTRALPFFISQKKKIKTIILTVKNEGLIIVMFKVHHSSTPKMDLRYILRCMIMHTIPHQACVIRENWHYFKFILGLCQLFIWLKYWKLSGALSPRPPASP